MQRQVVQAMVLCLAAMTLCGCSSGFRWPWSKKTAAVDSAATDPALAGADPTAGYMQPSQMAQNTPLPSGHSGPNNGRDAYPYAAAQPTGYGGAYSEAGPAAQAANAPGGVSAGYDTASTYNSRPANRNYPPAAYRPAVYPPVSNPAIVQETPPAAYDNSQPQMNVADPRYATQPNSALPTPPTAQPYGSQPYGSQPYGAQPYGAQPYGATPPYAATPPPGGAYPQPMNNGYASSAAAPDHSALQAAESDNSYRAPRYSLTTAGAPTNQPNVGTGSYGSVPAQSGRYPAADPFGAPPTAPPTPSYATAPPTQSYATAPQPYGASAPYGPATSAAPPVAAANPASNALPAGGGAAENPYVAQRYSSQPANERAPSAAPAPIDNRYAIGDPLFAAQPAAPATPAPALPAVAMPASQPTTTAGQLYRSVNADTTPPPAYDPPYAPEADVAADPAPAKTSTARTETSSPVGVPSKGSSLTKIGPPGESTKLKRGTDDRLASNSRSRSRPETTESSTTTGRASAPSPKARNINQASSRYKNPLRDD